MSETLGVAILRLATDDKELNAGLDKAKARTKKVGKEMRRVGKNMTLYVTTPILGLGAAVLKAAGDFETGMNQVRALTGATGDDFKKLREQAKDLGATTQFTAGQAADAMGFLAQAGLKTQDIYKTMPATLNLAAAAQTSLADTADMMTNIMAGFRMESGDSTRATDVLTTAFTNSNTNLVELAEAMSYAGPVLSGFGISFEETAAAVGLLGNAGIKASRAGTALSGALVRLASPSTEAAEIIEKLGINVFDSSGKMKPLVSIVGQLEDSGATAAEMMKIFGLRAGPAMLALVSQGSGALEDLTTKLENSGGTAKRIADVQMEGFSGAMKKLKSALEAVAIAIADSGMLEFATDMATALADWFREFAKTNPVFLKWGAIILAVTAALGPLITAMGVIIPLVVTLAAAVLGLSWPVLAVVAVIGILVGTIWYFWGEWEEIFGKILDWSIGWLADLMNAVFWPLMQTIKGVVALWEWMVDLVADTPEIQHALPGGNSSAGSSINQSSPDTGGGSASISPTGRQPVNITIQGDEDAMFSQTQVRRLAEALSLESEDDSTSLQIVVV